MLRLPLAGKFRVQGELQANLSQSKSITLSLAVTYCAEIGYAAERASGPPGVDGGEASGEHDEAFCLVNRPACRRFF